jgi:hypothetical protein
MITVNKVTYYSLYEYLGNPAGGELGKKVYEKSKLKKQDVATQIVENSKYKGKILCYTKEFLDDYFKFLITDKIPFTGGPLGRYDRPNKKI